MKTFYKLAILSSFAVIALMLSSYAPEVAFARDGSFFGKLFDSPKLNDSAKVESNGDDLIKPLQPNEIPSAEPFIRQRSEATDDSDVFSTDVKSKLKSDEMRGRPFGNDNLDDWSESGKRDHISDSNRHGGNSYESGKLTEASYQKLLKSNPEFKMADDELNALYLRLKKALPQNDFRKLRNAQRVWLKNGEIYRNYFIRRENMSLEEAAIANTKLRIKDFRMILGNQAPADYISANDLL